MATVADLRKSRQVLETADAAARRARRQISRAESRSRNRQPGEIAIPRQYEPRAAHAAQCHHRLLRNDGTTRPSAPSDRQKYLDYCTDIRESGEYLLGVISDVLDMSRLEAGRVRLEKADSRSTRRSAAHRRDSSGADEKRIAISHREPSRQIAPADRAALERVLTILLRNAVKFTPNGRPISVRTRLSRRRSSLCRRYRHGHFGRGARAARPAVRADQRPARQRHQRLGPRPRDRPFARRLCMAARCASARPSAAAPSCACICRTRPDSCEQRTACCWRPAAVQDRRSAPQKPVTRVSAKDRMPLSAAPPPPPSGRGIPQHGQKYPATSARVSMIVRSRCAKSGMSAAAAMRRLTPAAAVAGSKAPMLVRRIICITAA